MPLYIKNNNTWTKLNKYHNINGTNKEILNQYHKVNGVWKPVYSYTWNTSEWSSCSKPCGTGIQTRTATCVRNDGIVKEDKFCTLSGINKPVLQQYCNTQACFPDPSPTVQWKGIAYGGDRYKFHWNDLGTGISRFSAPEDGKYRITMNAHLKYVGGKSCVGCGGCDGSSSRHAGQIAVFLDGINNRSLCGSRCCTETSYWGMCYLGWNGLGVNYNTVQTALTEYVLKLVVGECTLSKGQTFNLRYWARMHTDQDAIYIEYDGPNFAVFGELIE